MSNFIYWWIIQSLTINIIFGFMIRHDGQDENMPLREWGILLLITVIWPIGVFMLFAMIVDKIAEKLEDEQG